MQTREGLIIRHFDYDRRLIPNSFVAAMDEAVTDIEQAKERTGKTVGYPGWNLLYYTAFCSLSAEGHNTIVETGTNWGFSAIILAQALRDSKLDGHVHTVEIDPDNYAKACDNVEKAGVDELVSLNLADSKEFLARFVANLEGDIRFAFLDGSHACAGVVREFELVHTKLADDSVVFFDNTYKIRQDDDTEQSVNGALRIITERFGGNLVNFPNTSWYTPGQAVWQRAAFSSDWQNRKPGLLARLLGR